jgi:hypothetical protein
MTSLPADEQLDEAECTRRGVQIAALKAEVYQLRGKLTRQRRELRRLNKTIGGFRAGARAHVTIMADLRARSALDVTTTQTEKS